MRRQVVPDASMAEWIRVSCAALCRIEHGGKFLLLLNRNRRAKGIYRLGPIGGALELLDSSYLKLFEAIPEDAAKNDLRLTIPHRLLPSFKQWFYSGMGREQSPFRELYEELVIEAKLLADLRQEDIACKLVWTIEDQDFTDRQGQTGLLTQYFLEVYDIKFKTPQTLGPLLTPSDESGALWLTENQITDGDTVRLQIDGAERDVHLRGQVVVRPPGSAGSIAPWLRVTQERQAVDVKDTATQAGESPPHHTPDQPATPDPDTLSTLDSDKG
ncbi:MAG: hypothetical protein JXA10_09675, partial [Anaerolineae bacterium]|nr:hypothetical protein [Anaerolineae bacterium]